MYCNLILLFFESLCNFWNSYNYIFFIKKKFITWNVLKHFMISCNTCTWTTFVMQFIENLLSRYIPAHFMYFCTAFCSVLSVTWSCCVSITRKTYSSNIMWIKWNAPAAKKNPIGSILHIRINSRRKLQISNIAW